MKKINYMHTHDNMSRKIWIEAMAKKGADIVLSTYLRAWKINQKTIEKFRNSGTELLVDKPNNQIGTQTYMRIGRRYDNIVGCAINAYFYEWVK